MQSKQESIRAISCIVYIMLFIPGFSFSQILETETARFLAPGEFQAGNAFEYQVSSEGTESAVPMAFEYGISKRVGILVEPVAFTQITPKLPSVATPISLGIGDIEATFEFLLNNEKKILPVFALAAEVKIPTAKNAYIGTGKPDYAFYLIASKKIHSFDFHGNITYTIVGSPDSIMLNNTFGFALASEYFAGDKFELYGEVLGVTSSAGENSGDSQNLPPGVVLTPEAAGGELSVTLGIGYRCKPGLLLSFGTSYDNNGAFLFRPGLTMNFK